MIDKIKAKVFNRKGAKFSFAQAGEDLVLQRIFMGVTKGFYVDVGAYHPYRLSNTYLFYANGWRGINIEPRPNSKKIFDDARPEDINLELGVAETPGKARYYMFREDTFNRFEFADLSAGTALDNQAVEIAVEPLSAIFRKHVRQGTAIDFISIDTEGSEYEILKSNDWYDFPIKVVLIEDNRKNLSFAESADLLRSKGYTESFRVPVNLEADSVFFIMK